MTVCVVQNAFRTMIPLVHFFFWCVCGGGGALSQSVAIFLSFLCKKSPNTLQLLFLFINSFIRAG